MACIFWSMGGLSLALVLAFSSLTLAVGSCVLFKYLWSLFFVLGILIDSDISIRVTLSARFSFLSNLVFILLLCFIILFHKLIWIDVWSLIARLAGTLSSSWRCIVALMLFQHSDLVFELEYLLFVMIICLLDFIWGALKLLHQNFGVLRNLRCSWWWIWNLLHNVFHSIRTMLALVHLLNYDGSPLLSSVRTFVSWVACYSLVTRGAGLSLLISFMLLFSFYFCLFPFLNLFLLGMLSNLWLVLCNQTVLDLSIIGSWTTIGSHRFVTAVIYVLSWSKIKLFLSYVNFIVDDDWTNHFANIVLVSHTF